MAMRYIMKQILLQQHSNHTLTQLTKITSPAPVIANDKITKPDQRNDGTLSDSGLSTQSESNKKRRPSMSSKAFVILGLSKKTNSSSNLGLVNIIIKIKIIFVIFSRKTIWFSKK